MKFHHLFYQISEYFLILILFIFPSILSKESLDFESKKEFIFALLYLVFSIFLLFSLNKKYKNTEKPKNRKPFLMSCIILCILLWISWIFSFFYTNQMIYLNNTSLFFQKLILIPFMVIFEEVLFRSYIHDSFLFIISQNNLSQKNIWKKFAAILLSSVFFALAHSYAGYFAIIFAFLSSILLFFLKNYTNSILFPILVHGLYNFIAFFQTFKL